MADFSVVTRIVGVDRLTEVVKRASAGLARLTKPTSDFADRLKRTDSSALGKVGHVADNVGGKFKGLVDRASAFAPVLSTILGAATLGGLFAMAKGWSESAAASVVMAQSLNISTQQLGLFRMAAKLANVETDLMDKGLAKLSKTIHDAATGKNADAALLFGRIGVKLRDAKGRIRDVTQVLPELAEAFKRNKDSPEIAAAAVALFGDEGAKLIAVLLKGRAGLDAAAAAQKRFGGTTREQSQAALKLNAAFKELDLATSGFSNRIAAAVAPRLIPLIERLVEWTVANREIIGQAIERKLDAIERFVDKLSRAWDYLIRLPVVKWLLSMVDASDALDAALALLGGTIAGPVLHILGVVTAAVWRMNAALLANPFILLAFAAAASAYIIFANWANIDSYFESKLGRVKQAFDRHWSTGVQAAVREFNPVVIMGDALNGLSKYLFDFDLYEAGRRLIQRLIEGVKSLLPSLSSIMEPLERIDRWLGRQAAAIGKAVATSPLNPAGGVAAVAGGGRQGPVPVDVNGAVKVDITLSGKTDGARASVSDSGAAEATIRVGQSRME